MKRTVLTMVCAATLLMSSAVSGVSSAENTADVKPAISVRYTPTTGMVFNNPRGSKAQKLAIITQIDRAIDSSPKGSTIRMAQYLFDINSTARKLIAAHQRGVNVQVLIDDGNATAQSARVKKALGSDTRRSSYVTTCKHGCMSDVASVMHAKFYLFSAVGSARLVSMISSANPYTGNTFTSWNNNHTIVGDAKIYSSLSRYFGDMILDRTDPNYYRTTTSGKYKLYLFPRGPQLGGQGVVPLDVLNHVSCSGVSRGYGSGGRTVVRVAMWGWSYGRVDVAKKLWDLHNKGCRVDVILNSGRTNSRVFANLLKWSNRYGRMRVYDAWRDRNHNELPELYIHHKLLMVNGKLYGRPNTRIVYTGSQNYTAPATLSNNDIVLRIQDDGVYNAYNNNLNFISGRYTTKIVSVPAVTWTKPPLAAVAADESSPDGDELAGVTDR